MTPQFNVLAGRFTVIGVTFAYGSVLTQGGRSFFSLTVRQGAWSHYEPRRVKGYDVMVSN